MAPQRVDRTAAVLRSLGSRSGIRDERCLWHRFLEPEVAILHGPFYREGVKPGDFVLVGGHELKAHLEEIRNLTGFAEPPTETQWAAIVAHVHEVQLQNPWCLHLNITEESKDRQSEGGFEFWVFREFLFAKPNVSTTRRLVFAYE